MATDWEERYREGDTPWDVGEVAPGLLEFLQDNRLEGRVLVPGCGRGNDVRALAEGGAQVVGIDVAPTALAEAARFPKVADETYVEASLFDYWREREASFDGVFEHTCFCAIDRAKRADYMQAVTALLRPGGIFLGVFFTRITDEDDSPPFSSSLEELRERFSPAFEEEACWTPAKQFERRLDTEEVAMRWRRRS